MSIAVMNRVWGSQAIADQGDLCILLALADWANDEGECWPSIPQLAKKARAHKATVHRRLAAMRGHWVKWEENSGGRSMRNQYQILLDNLSMPLPEEPKRSHRATVSEPPKESHGATVFEPETVAPCDSKRSHGATGNKPSYKPPVVNNKPTADVDAERVHAREAATPTTPVFDLSFLGPKDQKYRPGIEEALTRFAHPFPDKLIQDYWRKRSRIDFSSMAKLCTDYGWTKFVAAVVISVNITDTPSLALLDGILSRFSTTGAVMLQGEVPKKSPSPSNPVSVFGSEEEFNQLLRAR